MAQTIVQINYRFSSSTEEFRQLTSPAAPALAKVPGLLWKVWLLNEARGEAGGVYLFADEMSAQAYLDGPIVAQIQNVPFLGDFEVRVSAIMAPESAITRGPIAAQAALA